MPILQLTYEIYVQEILPEIRPRVRYGQGVLNVLKTWGYKKRLLEGRILCETILAI